MSRPIAVADAINISVYQYLCTNTDILYRYVGKTNRSLKEKFLLPQEIQNNKN